jgi:hypothetical protein
LWTVMWEENRDLQEEGTQATGVESLFDSGYGRPEHRHDEAIAARGRGDPTKTSDPFDPFVFSFLLADLNGKFPAVAIRIVEP